MKDANDVQSCLKSVCNRTFRPSSFTVPSKRFPAVSRPFNGGRVEEGGGGPAPTTIIYQFRILMSSRLIQKASTLRKRRERSAVLLTLSALGWPRASLPIARNGRRKRDGEGIVLILIRSLVVTYMRRLYVSPSDRSLARVVDNWGNGCLRSRGDALSFPPLPENRMTYNLPRISANRPREIARGNKGRGCAKRSGKMVYFITDCSSTCWSIMYISIVSSTFLVWGGGSSRQLFDQISRER